MADTAMSSLEGMTTTFEKTLTGDDVARFAALSGDDHPIHVDDAFAKRSGLPGRIVQGSLLVGLMAGASTKFFRDAARPALSYGYDKLRFTGVVNLGQRLTVNYKVVRHDRAESKTWADIQIIDETGRVVAVAQHIAKILPPESR